MKSAWKGIAPTAVFAIAILFAGFFQFSSRLVSPVPVDIISNANEIQNERSMVCLDVQLSGNSNDRYIPTHDEVTKCLVYEEPSTYIKLLSRMLVGRPLEGACNGGNCDRRKAYNPEDRKYGLDWPPFGYTMVGTQRLENFRAAILEVNRNKIPGIIAELGVWRGGAMIMAAAVCKESGLQRELYVFDAFESLPGYRGAASFLENSMEDVVDHFKLFDVYDDHVHFVKGLFKDTLPKFEDFHDPIAVLRVDGNFYDSYQDAMYYLYPKVPVGGIVIFDDVMSHTSVSRFWNDFRTDYDMPEKLNRIDKHSAWFRKEKQFNVDFAKMRAPQDANK